MRKLTTIITASIAGAALVMGGATVANAYPSGSSPILVTSKTTATAGSSISAAVLNVVPGTEISYSFAGQEVVSASSVYLSVPNEAGKYTLSATVGDDGPTGSDDDVTKTVTITVGKIVTKVTVGASPTTVAKGKKTKISGVVTPKSSGIYVGIEYRKYGVVSDYTSIKRVKTTTGGKFAYNLDLPKGTYYVKATTGDSKYSVKSSTTVKVTFK